jgi:hypothetical protein
MPYQGPFAWLSESFLAPFIALPRSFSPHAITHIAFNMSEMLVTEILVIKNTGLGT